MKDELYKKRKTNVEKFAFNTEVSKVFDDMIRRSVPGYLENLHYTSEIIFQNYIDGGVIYDMGCSTGELLYHLLECFNGKGFIYTGVDSSVAMVEKAREKLKLVYEKREVKIKGDSLSFKTGKLESVKLIDAGIIVCAYTLQFLAPQERLTVLTGFFSALKKGGMLLLSEKVIEEDEVCTNVLEDLHQSMKKRAGYSDLEISQKRDAIENFLIPFSVSDNFRMLEKAGFSSKAIYYKNTNFCSYVAIK